MQGCAIGAQTLGSVLQELERAPPFPPTHPEGTRVWGLGGGATEALSWNASPADYGANADCGLLVPSPMAPYGET